MGGPKGPMRGRKTHRADQLLNRGASELPDEAYENIPNEERHPSGKQHELADEHPTRMRATGRAPDRRNR